MSKHKKRVNLGQRAAEQQAPAARRALASDDAAPVAEEPEAIEAVEAATVVASPEEAAEPEQSPSEERPGIERRPVFWFILGALTVGIIVLMGLLLMGTGSAAPAAKPAATKPAIRAATTTPVAAATLPAQAAQPNIAATVTAAAQSNESVPRISLDETKKKLDAGAILLVDVRSDQSYAEKHVKGAINIPEPDTESRLSEFPKDKEIVLYCA